MNVYPTLAGLGWPVARSPIFDTIFQQSVSGRVTTATYMQYPLYEFTLQYNYLSASDLDQLKGFFLQQQGRLQPFWFNSGPGDNSVTDQATGEGDGTTTTFPLLKSTGTFVEPIGESFGAPQVFLNGGLVQAAADPTIAPVLGSVVAGALVARTYYIGYTYHSLGREAQTLLSPISSLPIALDDLVTVASPPGVPDVYAYEIYASETAGAETKQANIVVGTDWTEPATGLITGVAPPTVNQTGLTFANGAATFGGPPYAYPLTWTGNYYYQCRFKKDAAQFDEFMSQLHELQSVTLRTYR